MFICLGEDKDPATTTPTTQTEQEDNNKGSERTEHIHSQLEKTCTHAVYTHLDVLKRIRSGLRYNIVYKGNILCRYKRRTVWIINKLCLYLYVLYVSLCEGDEEASNSQETFC